MMKIFYPIILSVTLMYTVGCSSKEEQEENNNIFETGQVTLYDNNKEAIAYIDYDDERTIYLWDGTPVAYLVSENKTIDGDEVFGFNGICLGWYYEGILYDYNGYVVGAKKGIIKGSINTTATHIEKIKSIKHIKPIKHIHHVSLAQHVFTNKWSETDLTTFLNNGINDK